MLHIYPVGYLLQVTGVNVKGPDGYAFLGILITLLLPLVIYLIVRLIGKRSRKTGNRFFLRKHTLALTLDKNKLYHPESLRMAVRNTGNTDVDIDRPMLVFSWYLLQRKFKLKGTEGYHFYPLLLEPGKVHELSIDLGHFYRYDPHLKKFPKITIAVNSIDGSCSVKKSVRIRKTLFA